MILHLIGQIGAAGGTGYAVEYAGSAVRGLGIEGRLTICNLSIELGAKYGLVAPDDITFEYLSGRPMSPRGALWDEAVRDRSEEHTSELQSLMRTSYAVFCLKKKKQQTNKHTKQEEREILTQHSTTNQIKHAYM